MSDFGERRGPTPEGLRTPEIPTIQVEFNRPFKLTPLPELPKQINLNDTDDGFFAIKKTLAHYDLAIAGLPKVAGMSSSSPYKGEARGKIFIAASIAAAKDIMGLLRSDPNHPTSLKPLVDIAGMPKVSYQPEYISSDSNEVEIIASELPLLVDVTMLDIPSLADTRGMKLFARFNGRVIDNEGIRNPRDRYNRHFEGRNWKEYDRSGDQQGEYGLLLLPYNQDVFTALEFVIGNQKPQP